MRETHIRGFSSDLQPFIQLSVYGQTRVIIDNHADPRLEGRVQHVFQYFLQQVSKFEAQYRLYIRVWLSPRPIASVGCLQLLFLWCRMSIVGLVADHSRARARAGVHVQELL